MRGTRVDYMDADHIRIIYFGSFATGEAANEFMLSEKDFMNLFNQMQAARAFYILKEDKNVALDKRRDSDSDNIRDDVDWGPVPDNVKARFDAGSAGNDGHDVKLD